MHAPRIVLIEDNRQTSDMIIDFLHTNFSMAKTIVFSSGEEAIEKLTETPELFIIDYYLDTVNPTAQDGIQIMMRLKDEYDAPVIFLSAQEDATIAANTIKYGAEDYVAKNNQNSFNRLEIAINNVLHNSQLQRDIVKQRRFILIFLFLLLTLVAGVILTKVLS